MNEKKFYQKSIDERLEELKDRNLIDEPTLNLYKKSASFDISINDNLSENVIGELALPIGLGQNFIVNNHEYLVPMSTEEPSVVAAASHGAKIVANAGGFTAHAERNGICGQIIFEPSEDFDPDMFVETQELIFEKAQTTFASLYEHGGEIKEIQLRDEQSDEVELIVLVDTAEAMGANIVNKITQWIGELLLEQNVAQSIIFAILSNYPSQLTTASVSIPVDLLTNGETTGLQVAEKIDEINRIAQFNVYRSATNNKGIMNGIDAVLTATGNDTRAVETSNGILAYQNKDGYSLSKWTLNTQKATLDGQLTVSLPIGSVGGSINARPLIKANLALLDNPSAKELSEIIASVGLANNLAAQYAIVTDGIVKGHMNLQLKNDILAIEPTEKEFEQVLKMMREQGLTGQSNARKILEKIRGNN